MGSSGIPKPASAAFFSRSARFHQLYGLLLKYLNSEKESGQVVIFKRNKPKYLLINLNESPIIEMTDDEKIDFVATRLLKKYRIAFEELAK